MRMWKVSIYSAHLESWPPFQLQVPTSVFEAQMHDYYNEYLYTLEKRLDVKDGGRMQQSTSPLQ